MKNISLWIFLFGITSPGAFVAGEIFSDSDKNYHQDLKAAFFFLLHTDSFADSLNLFTSFDGLFCFSFVSDFLRHPIYACNEYVAASFGFFREPHGSHQLIEL